MEPIVIDIAGTARELVKWVLGQILFLLGIILFGLSAPLLFTVGIEILAWRGSHMEMWADLLHPCTLRVLHLDGLYLPLAQCAAIDQPEFLYQFE